MGTDKRQRQKEGRQARIAAAEAAQHRAHRRRRYLTFVISAIVVLGGFALINWLTGNNHSKSVSTAAASTTTVAPTTTLASAKGKNCVAMKGTPPKGAPTVAVQVGPPPTELVVKDLKVGTGPAVVPTDTITVNYIGVACSTGKIFDSSWSRGQTATFGLNQVIKGWTTGLTGMKVGGSRLLGIPSSLGYASQSPSPDIAPDESLWFVVDLVKIAPPATTTTGAAGSTTTTAATGSTTTTATGSTTTTSA
jgi:FKBP-type peptidyl-prolyl cis-trans isomerase